MAHLLSQIDSGAKNKKESINDCGRALKSFNLKRKTRLLQSLPSQRHISQMSKANRKQARIELKAYTNWTASKYPLEDTSEKNGVKETGGKKKIKKWCALHFVNVYWIRLLFTNYSFTQLFSRLKIFCMTFI